MVAEAAEFSSTRGLREVMQSEVRTDTEISAVDQAGRFGRELQAIDNSWLAVEGDLGGLGKGKSYCVPSSAGLMHRWYCCALITSEDEHDGQEVRKGLQQHHAPAERTLIICSLINFGKTSAGLEFVLASMNPSTQPPWTCLNFPRKRYRASSLLRFPRRSIQTRS